MKIKEVSRSVGLTEKSIRFYEEKGLISPEGTDKSGRFFREYTEQDLERLRQIACLRKWNFSVEEVKLLLDRPQEIHRLLQLRGAREKRTEQASGLRREVLKQLEQQSFSDVASLCAALREGEKRVWVELDEPDFGRVDELDEGAERITREEYEAELEEKARQNGRQKRFWFRLLAGFLVLALLAGACVFSYTKNKKVQDLEENLRFQSEQLIIQFYELSDALKDGRYDSFLTNYGHYIHFSGKATRAAEDLALYEGGYYYNYLHRLDSVVSGCSNSVGSYCQRLIQGEEHQELKVQLQEYAEDLALIYEFCVKWQKEQQGNTWWGQEFWAAFKKEAGPRLSEQSSWITRY